MEWNSLANPLATPQFAVQQLGRAESKRTPVNGDLPVRLRLVT
jgi:hypothetical protein